LKKKKESFFLSKFYSLAEKRQLLRNLIVQALRLF